MNLKVNSFHGFVVNNYFIYLCSRVHIISQDGNYFVTVALPVVYLNRLRT